MPKTKRQDIIDFARTLIGIPFVHQGRTKYGLDCVGVIVTIARHFKLTFHDITGYPKYPDGVTLPRELNVGLVALPERRCVQPGDVISFWIRHPQKMQHVALATDRGILHSYHSVNPIGVIESNLDAFWADRAGRCYRFPNVEDDPYPTKFTWPVAEDPKVLDEVQRRLRSMGQTCCGN